MMEHAQEQVDTKIGGVPVSIKGLNMVVFISLVAVTSYTIYYLSEVVSREHRAIAGSVDGLKDEIHGQTEAIIEQNYILLADEKETADIRRKMHMPPSLRRKLNE